MTFNFSFDFDESVRDRMALTANEEIRLAVILEPIIRDFLQPKWDALGFDFDKINIKPS